MKANTEAIRMALYGWHYDVENETDDYIDNILKENGSPITTGIFTSDCYKEMSGVFFSTLATTGKFRALSREPLCAFEQLRFNESSQLRKYQIDCRLDCKRNSHKYYSYLNHINNHIKKNPVDYQSIAAEPRNPLVCTNGYTETIADGLHFYINPFASTPKTR